jgi:hypothetical protein
VERNASREKAVGLLVWFEQPDAEIQECEQGNYAVAAGRLLNRNPRSKRLELSSIARTLRTEFPQYGR